MKKAPSYMETPGNLLLPVSLGEDKGQDEKNGGEKGSLARSDGVLPAENASGVYPGSN